MSQPSTPVYRFGKPPEAPGKSPFDEASRCIWAFYGKQPDLAKLLEKLLYHTLANQLVEYNAEVYDVTEGQNTGLQAASELATIYLMAFDTFLLERLARASHCTCPSILYQRYIDDGLHIFHADGVTQDQYNSWLNEWNDQIKIEKNEFANSAVFLDLFIWKQENVQGAIFVHKACRKPMNIYGYIPPSSDHCTQNFDGVIRGEAIRMLRLNVFEKDYEREIAFFLRRWAERGHDIRRAKKITSQFPFYRKTEILDSCSSKSNKKP